MRITEPSRYLWTTSSALGPDKIESEEKLDTVARLFLALRDDLQSLDTFYCDLEMPSPDRQCNRGDIFFPHVLSYRKTDRVVPIKYIAQLGPNNKSKAVFKGEDSDGQRIFVKFTDRYNAYGHRLLAEQSLSHAAIAIY